MKTSNKNAFKLDNKTIGTFFLGVGITIFILNVIALLQLLPHIQILKEFYGAFPLYGFYISVISSVILMSYSLYNIYH